MPTPTPYKFSATGRAFARRQLRQISSECAAVEIKTEMKGDIMKVVFSVTSTHLGCRFTYPLTIHVFQTQFELMDYPFDKLYFSRHRDCREAVAFNLAAIWKMLFLETRGIKNTITDSSTQTARPS